MSQSTGKDGWDKASIISNGLVPILIAFFGTMLTLRSTEKVEDQRMVELAVGILQNDPSNTPQPELRKWSAKVIAEYSEVPLSKEALTEVLETPLAINQSDQVINRLATLETLMLDLQSSLQMPSIEGRAQYYMASKEELEKWLLSFEEGQVLFPIYGEDAPWRLLDCVADSCGVVTQIDEIINISILSSALREFDYSELRQGKWKPAYMRSNAPKFLETEFACIALCTIVRSSSIFPSDMIAGRELEPYDPSTEKSYCRIQVRIVQELESREIVDAMDLKVASLDPIHYPTLQSAAPGLPLESQD